MHESDRYELPRYRNKFESAEFKQIEAKFDVNLSRWKEDFSEPIAASYTFIDRFSAARIAEPLQIHIDYMKRMLNGYEAVHFIEGTRGMPGLRKIRKLANDRLLKALVLRAPESISCISARDLSRFWRAIRATGAELHFSEIDSPLNAFLQFNDVAEALAQRSKMVGYGA